MVKIKTSIKTILASILLVCSMNLSAQNNVDIVTQTTTAEGKTKDEAVTTALRNAIEQTFGTFISSKTEIVNDDLIKDEIVSVSSGNIQKYEILSSTILPNGNTFVSVQSNVSVSKLTKFTESKGIEAEFKGALFSANVKLQQLYEKNTITVLNNLITIIKGIIADSYDYKISVSDPVFEGNDMKGDRWRVQHTIDITPNKNMENVYTLLVKTLAGISLNEEERKNYKSLNKNVFEIAIVPNNKKVVQSNDSRRIYGEYRGKVNRNYIEYFYLRTGMAQIDKLWDLIMVNKFVCVVDNGLSELYFKIERCNDYHSKRLEIFSEREYLHKYVNQFQFGRGKGSTCIGLTDWNESRYTLGFGVLDGNTKSWLDTKLGFSFQSVDLTGKIDFTIQYYLSDIEKIQKYTVKPNKK